MTCLNKKYYEVNLYFVYCILNLYILKIFDIKNFIYTHFGRISYIFWTKKEFFIFTKTFLYTGKNSSIKFIELFKS